MTDKIRLAKKEDQKIILQLYNSNDNLWYRKSSQAKFTKKEISEYIASKKDKMFVFERDKKVIGVLFAEFHSDYVYLHTVVVDKKYRGHGIGHMLMDKLMEEAKKQKKVSMEAITEKRDIAMQKIFKELNYKRGKVFIGYQKLI